MARIDVGYVGHGSPFFDVSHLKANIKKLQERNIELTKGIIELQDVLARRG